jgi:glycosyltransferase involved in cell wall biosynthesis
MKIVVDFRTKKNFSPSVNSFFEQLLVDLMALEPAYQYLFLRSNVKADAPFKLFTQVIKSSGFKWLNQIKLLKLLNKYEADKYIVLREDGLLIMTPAKKVFVKKDVEKPPVKIVFSEYHKLRLQELNDSKSIIHVIKLVMQNIVSSLSWAETESIKTQYTGGRDFFLFTGDIDTRYQLVELLKAFSIFKKWQQSNMQLVIAGYVTLSTFLFEEKLSSYKYHQEVVVLKNLSVTEIARLTAAAYAMLCPATENNLPFALVQAIQSGIAVVASDNPVNRQLTNAVIWIDNDNLQDGFAKAMMLLYKDENQKQLLVQKAKEEAKQFNRQQMVEEIWQSIKQK